MLKTELYENAFGWLAYDKTTYYTELYLLSYMQLKKKLSRVGGGGGSSLIENFSQIFPFFFSDGSPKYSSV